MTIDELLAKWRAGRREVTAALDELNSADDPEVIAKMHTALAMGGGSHGTQGTA